MKTINKFFTTNLGSIAKVQTGPFGSQLHEKDYVEKGTPIITVEHLGYGGIIKNDIPCVSEYDVLRLKKFLLKTGDIVFSRVGSVDRSVLIRHEEDGWMFSGRCLRVRLTTKDVLPAYLYYYFTQNSFRQYVRNNAVGATMPSLNSNILRRLKILYPPLSKQVQINDILSTIDDTLANNYTRIQLLEEAARLLFREWFVYFRFPGYEKVQIVDGVPEGWKKIVLGKIAGRIKKSYSINDEDLPLVDLARIQSRTLAITEVGVFSDLETARIIFEKDDILFSSIRPYLHKVVLAPFKGITNTSVFVVRSKKQNYRAYLTLLMFSDYAVQFANQHSTGTKMPVVKWDSVSMIPAWIPPENIMNEFQDIVGPMLEQIQLSYFINQKLAQARDLLLPRLMSGAIEA